jgi:hypothetical protein
MGFRAFFNFGPFRERTERKAAALVHDVADYTAARAVDYAPVDTGFLASHIQVIDLAGNLGSRVVSTAFYSMWVHDGHLSRGGNWVPGRPFLTMALADARREFPRIAARQTVSTGGVHNPEGFLSTTFTT